MSFKFFLIPAVVLSLLYGFAMASVASAEVTITISLWESECVLVDDTVECDITSEYGISNVNVFMNTGIGDVTVFDQDYEDCPNEVQVSLDPIVLEENSEMHVTTCESPFEVEPVPAILCINGECPGEDAVGRPDPLPLKLKTAPAGPANSFVTRK